MVYNAEQCARNAEADTRNDYGMCLQQTRLWCGIGSYYPDATTAWKHTNHRHPGDRHPPRGAPVYWTGGSHGYGHIALSLGNGKIRSTDAGGSGHVATVDLGWVETHWGLPYAGWAEDINEVTIPGIGDASTDTSSDAEDDMPLTNDEIQKIATAVWNHEFAKWAPDATQNEGKKINAAAQTNQARGYAEDGYDRITKVEKDVAAIKKKLGA